MPNAWEIGPSSYTLDDVQIQFRIRQVLVLPEYMGYQNVISKVKFSILSTLEDLNWEQVNEVWLDIYDIQEFKAIDNITEEDIKNWVINKHLGPDGFLNVRRGHLQIFNEQYRDKTSIVQPFDFAVDQPLYQPPPPTPINHIP